MTIFYGPRDERIPAMLDALASDTRRSILWMLRSPSLTATEIGDRLGMRQQTISEHLAVLECSGLVQRVGWCRYAVDQHEVRHVKEFINRHFMEPETTRRML
jgi:DNA-binding transcriptional ArsR family regulator